MCRALAHQLTDGKESCVTKVRVEICRILLRIYWEIDL
jgi:hypothetical protein